MGSLQESGGISTKFNRAQVAGTLFLVSGILFVLGVNIAESVYPGYSVSGNWVSDLGATCATTADYRTASCAFVQPASDIFRSAFGALGVFVLLGAYLMFPVARSRWFFVLVGLVGLGAFGGAIVTMADVVVHTLFALVGFLSAVIVTIYSFRFVRRPVGYVWIGLGLIQLAALVILITVGGEVSPPTWTPLGKGGMERMVLYPLALWFATFGCALLTEPEPFLKPSALGAEAGQPAEASPAGPTTTGRSAKPPL